MEGEIGYHGEEACERVLTLEVMCKVPLESKIQLRCGDGVSDMVLYNKAGAYESHDGMLAMGC